MTYFVTGATGFIGRRLLVGGTAGEIDHALAPRAATRLLNRAYKLFPDSTAARGDGAKDATREQLTLARILKGGHW